MMITLVFIAVVILDVLNKISWVARFNSSLLKRKKKYFFVRSVKLAPMQDSINELDVNVFGLRARMKA